MGEIVNLRTARKRRDRDEKTRLADENRVRHGRTKGEKQRDKSEASRLADHIDAHRRDPGQADDTGE